MHGPTYFGPAQPGLVWAQPGLDDVQIGMALPSRLKTVGPAHLQPTLNTISLQGVVLKEVK